MKTKHLLTAVFIIAVLMSSNAQSGAKYATGGNATSIGDIFGTTNNQPINFVTNNTLKMVLDASGSLRLLNLAGTGNRLVITDVNGKFISLPQGSANQVLYGNGAWGNLPSIPSQLWNTSGNDIFYNSGNVGIGIAPSPIFKLDVVGDVRISNNLFVGGGIITTDKVHAATQIKSLDIKIDNSLGVQGTSSFTGAATFEGNLKNTTLAGTGERILVADANGNLKPIGGSGNGNPCANIAMPWYLGGNALFGTSLPNNNIGTCTNQPFILKSNDLQSVFIQPNGSIGVGPNNSSPNGILDISDGTSGPGPWHFRIYGNANGDVVSTTGLKLSYGGYGGGNTFEINYGGGLNRMLINGNGKIGLGESSNTAPNNANVNVNVSANSVNAFEVYNAGFPLGAKSTFKIRGDGKTIIGEQTQFQGPHTNALLTVYGKMVATSCYIKAIDWADYVFASDYKVPNLYDIEKYYKANKHLPEIPTENEVKENGIDVAEMNKLLLKKIEEMTIIMVQQQKDIDLLKSKNK